MPSNKAVFLDRDNTLIHNDGDLGDPERIELIKGVASAVASLSGLGYKLIVITNQGGVARGRYDEDAVDAMHYRLNEMIAATSGARIDRFYFCPYHPDGTVRRYRREHPWRKPQPGMLLQAAKDMDIDLKQSWTIGDQLRDVQAGLAAGTRCILLQDQNSEDARSVEAKAPVFFAPTLIEAVRLVGQQRKPEEKKVASHGQSSGAEDQAAAVSTTTRKKARKQNKRVEKKQRAKAAAIKVDATAEPDIEPAVETPSAVESPEPTPATETAAVRSEGAADSQVEAEVADQPSEPSVKAGADKPSKSPKKKRKSGKQRSAAKSKTDTEVPADKESSKPVASDARPNESSTDAATDAAASPELEAIETAEAEARVDHSAVVNAAPEKPDRSADNIERTLRQILHEIRGQRSTAVGDFSFVHMLAIILQLVAAVCLAAALLMPGGDAMFQRLVAVAVVAQLATIAMLLFRR